MDDLLCSLNNSGFGCHIGLAFFNAFMFADDILLLTITITDLQQLLYICEDELHLLDMSLNAAKSSILRIGDNYNVPLSPIILGGLAINSIKSLCYLGVTTLAGIRFDCDFHPVKLKFFR